MWIKRSDHAPKSGCLDFVIIGPNRAVWRFIFFHFVSKCDLLSSSLPFFPLNYSNVWHQTTKRRRRRRKNLSIRIPDIVARKTSFAFLIAISRWTMILNKVGLKKSMKTSDVIITLTFCFLM